MLFKTTAELQTFISVDKNTTFTVIKPFIQDAEDNYIAKVLGAAQLNALQTAYDGNTLTMQQTALLLQVRKALSKLALYSAIPSLNIHINDIGIMKALSADYENADKTEVYFARIQFLIDGYKALDNLYAFMELNKADYSLWVSSTSYSEFKAYFVNTANEFFKHTGIDSRWLFVKLVPQMDTIETLRIKGTIGDDFLADLKSKFAASTLNSNEQTLVNMLAKPIALYTYAAALTNPTTIETLRLIQATTADELSNKGRPTLDYKEDYADLAEEKVKEADALMAAVVKYLNNNASSSVFDIYFNSSLYVDPTKPADKISDYGNNTSNSSFAMV